MRLGPLIYRVAAIVAPSGEDDNTVADSAAGINTAEFAAIYALDAREEQANAALSTIASRPPSTSSVDAPTTKGTQALVNRFGRSCWPSMSFIASARVGSGKF